MNRIPFATFIQFHGKYTEKILTKITNYIITGKRKLKDIEKNGIKFKVKNEEFIIIPDEVLFQTLTTILKFMR